MTLRPGRGELSIGSAAAGNPEIRAAGAGSRPSGRAVGPHYLELLLRGDQLGANQLIRGLLDAGTPIIDVYLGIFQPALREAGALWARNQISVEDEHYVSAATQLIMAQIYPMVPSKKRVGRKALLACVEGELHDIGLRMVADLFEMNGWDGLFLGAGTAIDSIPTVIEKHRPDILLLSAAIDANLPAARETILKVRRRPREISPPIMVGGCLFNQHAGLWREIGADAYSRITKEVVPAAENLRSIRRSKP